MTLLEEHVVEARKILDEIIYDTSVDDPNTSQKVNKVRELLEEIVLTSAVMLFKNE